LPANWGKIGLSDEQKQHIYKLQADYSEKIIALEKHLKEMRAKERQALEAVPNDEQKKLKDIILKKAGEATRSSDIAPTRVPPHAQDSNVTGSSSISPRDFPGNHPFSNAAAGRKDKHE
jgi:hypothetical protein